MRCRPEAASFALPALGHPSSPLCPLWGALPLQSPICSTAGVGGAGEITGRGVGNRGLCQVLVGGEALTGRRV